MQTSTELFEVSYIREPFLRISVDVIDGHYCSVKEMIVSKVGRHIHEVLVLLLNPVRGQRLTIIYKDF